MFVSDKVPVNFLYTLISFAVFVICSVMVLVSFKTGAVAVACFFAAILFQALGYLAIIIVSFMRTAFRLYERFK